MSRGEVDSISATKSAARSLSHKSFIAAIRHPLSVFPCLQASILFQTLLKSLDLGLTWQELPLQLNAYDEVMGMQFVDANNGFLGMGYRNLRTTDGGMSWTEFKFPFYSISNAHFASLLDGVGFEDRWDDNGKRPNGDYVGKLFSTTDGWQTWDESSYSKIFKYSRVSFPETEAGFLMGYGTFYRIFKN